MKIKADLRFLLVDQEVSYLSDKYYIGDTVLVVDNINNLAVNDFVLLGTLGSEYAEIKKISSISSNTITLTAGLTFDHSQDTTVSQIAYDKINFYRSATVTGVLTLLNVSPQTITPDNIYNSYNDTANTTGFGWFRFYNSVTAESSSLSNAVPYAGWADNSVKLMLDSFYTQIGNRQRKLISDGDAIRWLSEAYTIALNKLNIVNREYSVPTPQTISIISGTAEYALPDLFSKVRTVTNADGDEIFEIPYEQSPMYANTTTPPGGSLEVKYYLRGSYLGITPTPSANDTYYLYYSTTAPVISSYIDYLTLPSANHYFLLDWMLFRATPLIGGDPKLHLTMFEKGLENLIISSHKRGGGNDSWEIDSRTIV